MATTFCNDTNYITNAKISSGRAIIKVDKSADKYYADIGDVLTYNLLIRNIGDTPANNIRIVSEMKQGMSFISSSFSVNGEVHSALNPYLENGAGISSINAGDFVSVAFKAKVINMPDPNEIVSSSTIRFSYTQDPSIPNGVTEIIRSNPIKINIKHVDLDITSSTDKCDVRLGDEITYKTLIKNTGNIEATNIMFMNTIPEGCCIIGNSYMLDGQVLYGVDSTPRYGGVRIGTLAAKKEHIITFKVRVNILPSEGIINNTSSIKYDYTIDPTKGNEVPRIVKANSTLVNVREAIITYYHNYGIEKMVDRKYADIGDIITYTVQLRNTGSEKANEILLTDTIPEGTKFMPNSVILNGRLETGVSPQPGMGVHVGSICPNGVATVSYKVQVVTLPKCSPILSMARVDYKFTVNNFQPNKAKGVGYSKVVNTSIRNGKLVARLIGDKIHASIGEIITYTLSISNIGNVGVENIRVLNNIPDSTVFIPESITLNCKHLMFGNVERGIVIPCLTPNKTVILNFKVKIKSILESGKIKNFSKLTYQYYKDENYTLAEKDVCSNNFYTNLHSVDFENSNFEQKSDCSFAAKDDLVSYTFNIKNAGNIRATEMMFYDTLPCELEFIKDSLTINGDTSYGGNPECGIVLGSLGSNDSFELKFSAKVRGTPSRGVVSNRGVVVYKYNMNPSRPLVEAKNVSNEVVINIRSPKITLTKTVNPTGTSAGKVVTFTVIATNSGNYDTEDVVIRDTLHPLLEFKEESVTVDGRYNSSNIINGVSLGKLRAGASKEIAYKTEIVGFPEEGYINTTALSRYRFVVDPAEVLRTETSESNPCKLIIEKVNVVLKKKSTSEDVNIGSVITYNVEIENKSSVKVTDFIFRDELPPHLEFNSNSFSINGVVLRGVNIRTGVMIRYINPRGKVHISYKVKVNSVPGNCRIANTAYGEFNYKILRDSPVEVGRTNMAKTEIRIPLPSFKQITLDSAFKLPPDKPNIVEIENVRVNVEVANSYVSKNPSTVCDDDGPTTGYKLIVNGFIKCDVEYTAEGYNFGVYSASFRKPFTTYIMLSSNVERTRDIDVRAFAEDVSYNVVSAREIRVNTIFMVDGKVL